MFRNPEETLAQAKIWTLKLDYLRRESLSKQTPARDVIICHVSVFSCYSSINETIEIYTPCSLGFLFPAATTWRIQMMRHIMSLK